MRLRSVRRLLLLLASLSLAEGCASRSQENLPTLKDYSDGTNLYVEALRAAGVARR